MIKVEKLAPGALGMAIEVTTHSDIRDEAITISKSIRECDMALIKYCSEPLITMSIRDMRTKFCKRREELMEQRYIKVEDFEKAIKTAVEVILQDCKSCA